MALWGKTDALASKPKYLTKLNTFNASSSSVVSTTAETIAIPGHGFVTGDAVAYESSGTAIGGLTDGTTYYAIRVDANTIKLASSASNATAGTAINLSAVGAGTADTLQLTAPTLFFVDSSEAQVPENKARGITGAGWWLYRTFTDAQSVTRHKAECLVSMAVVPGTSGDASDDAVVVDAKITIVTQPADASGVQNVAAGQFTVVASVIPASATLTYQWQKQEGGSGAWANVSGATSATYSTGTGITVAADNGDKYRVVVTAGDVSVTSNAATLTVSLP